MISIHQKEKALLERWIKRSEELGHGNNLAPDGLLYRGSLVRSNGFWSLNEGNEEELWQNATKRLLIITKDLNNIDDDGNIVEAWDIREETGLNNQYDEIDYESCVCFYKRLRMWAYGLLNMDSDGNYPAFKDARNMENSGPFYIHAPIARINCKKQCGSSSISDSVLKSYLDSYQDLLVENIAIYDADIILCCAGSGIIKNFIKEHYLTDLRDFPSPNEPDDDNCWLYYSPSTGKIVINSWHPSVRQEYEGVYNRMMESYSYFIKNKETLVF